MRSDPVVIGDRPSPARSRGRPPLSEADLSARRERIIEVAARLFFAHGFADTGLEAIGKAAGVTRRTIYELIGDKQTLFRAACNNLRAEGPHFQFSVPVAGRSAREVLADMARQLLDHAYDPELIALQRAILTETARSPKIISTVIIDGKTNLDRAIGRILERLADAGVIPRIDAVRAAGIFYDVVVGARGFRAMFGHPSEAGCEIDIAIRIDMFLQGYVDRAERL